MIPPLVRLNGRMMTRRSVAIRLNGVIRLTGVESAEWSDEVPMELVPGMNEGGLPLGVAAGNYGCMASISLYADEAANFEKAVLLSAPLAAGALSSAPFQLSIVMREDVRTNVIALVNCSIKSRGTSVGNDGAALVKKYDLQPTLVTENGVSLVSLLPAL